MKIEVGFTGILTIVFIILKLTGVLAWSWWWIFSLIWLPVAFIVVLYIIVIARVLGAGTAEYLKSRIKTLFRKD